MFVGKGGRFKWASSCLFHNLFPHVSHVSHVLHVSSSSFGDMTLPILEFAGVPNPPVKHILPSLTLGKMKSEMRNLSTLHVAAKISKADR